MKFVENLLLGLPIAVLLYVAIFGGLEWAIKRDEPQVPRYTGLANEPRGDGDD